MKRIVSIALAAVLVLAIAPMFVNAYCGGGGRQSSVRYAICAVESCDITGLHNHNGKTYTAHYYNDGHDYHEYCGYEDCLETGYHAHDDEYCFGHTYNDGHAYHGTCIVGNCFETGYHEHNGSYCFGRGRNTYGRFGRGCR